MQQQPSISDSLSRDAASASDSLSAMMERERTSYRRCDYLRRHRPSPSSPSPCAEEDVITEADRLKIVDWCYSVIDQCKFDRETVAVAMELADRFLSRPGDVADRALRDRSQFQLLAMAALYVAVKATEKLALGSDFFSNMSQGVYSVRDVEAMELELLKGLSWRIYAPTSVQMAHYIMSVVCPHVTLSESTWGLILDEIRFQTEHAVRDYYLATQRPSTVAVAAIFNSLDHVDRLDRQAILRALLLVMNREYDSPELIMKAKDRLRSLIKEHEDEDQDEGDQEDDDAATVVSASSGEEDDRAESLKREPEEELDQPSKRARRNPEQPSQGQCSP